jgi:hypothetical protein
VGKQKTGRLGRTIGSYNLDTDLSKVKRHTIYSGVINREVMKEEVTPKRLPSSQRAGNTYTIKAICGFWVTYEFGHNKKFQTPFITTPDYTCEECKAAYALEVLGNVP